MKFLITKDLEYSALFKNLIFSVLMALFFYLLLDVFLHAIIIGMDIASVSNTLYGDEDSFVEAMLLDSLLLQIHIDLFMNIIALMIISSVYIRFFTTQKMTKVLVHLLLILGLLAPFLLLLAYFTSEVFIYGWIISFILGHLLGMVMIAKITKRLLVT